jgi:sulfate permease, SulP family
MSNKDLEPKLISVLKEGYTAKIFGQDLLAGVIVGIVALPLSIAFAIASGVKPEQGIITAVVAGFIISALSGSRVQVGGPTGAFIVIIFDIVQKYGYDGLATATVMAGVFLILMGLARMGDVIKFIPYPVIVGFTSGIALIIFTTQIPDFFGLMIPKVPDHFLLKWSAYISHLSTANLNSVWLGLLTILIIVYWPRVTRRFPGPLIAIVLTTFLVQILQIPVETIGSRFGEVPNRFVPPKLPTFDFEIAAKLSSPALTIALLAGIESLLSAVVADGMTGRRHRSNMELIAQGVANIVSPIFNGIPATGAIARTATNIKNGGLTPVSGMVHALVVLILFLFFGKLAGLIPMAALAGILIVVAYNMSEWHLFVKLLRTRKGDIIVLLITFLLTVLVDLTVAIEVGVVLAAFLFMHRVVAVTRMSNITQDLGEEDPNDPFSIIKRKIPEGIEVYEINGPFFMGAADKFRDMLREVQRKPKILILRMRFVPSMDATGLRTLEDLYDQSARDKTTLILSGVNQQLLNFFKDSGFLEKVGRQNIHENINLALDHARSILDQMQSDK